MFSVGSAMPFIARSTKSLMPVRKIDRRNLRRNLRRPVIEHAVRCPHSHNPHIAQGSKAPGFEGSRVQSLGALALLQSLLWSQRLGSRLPRSRGVLSALRSQCSPLRNPHPVGCIILRGHHSLQLKPDSTGTPHGCASPNPRRP